MAAPTLVAAATPPGRSAIAVVRLSGPQAFPMLDRLCARPADGWTPRLARRRTLRDPRDGALLDDALILPFRAPGSYTGEDLIEFHLHGNPVIVGRLLEVLVDLGARPAEAGAFTRRAVLSGRLGLPEAEALADLVDAASPRGVAQALARMGGTLRPWTEALRNRLLDVRARLEAIIDFPEEGIDPGHLEAHASALKTLAGMLREEADRARAARVWTTGATIVIAGAPNAGKSTLINCLLGVERAIVGPQAGTTRDWLEVPVALAGLPVRLIDTAGLRETTEAVEAEGVRRARVLVDEADLVIWLRAADAPEEPWLHALLTALPPQRRLVVWNKRDLAAPAGEVDLALAAGGGDDVAPLVTAIVGRLAAEGADPRVGNLRQEKACRRAAAALETAAATLLAGAPVEIAVEDIRPAERALAELIGEVDAEAVLDRLFSSFCIGK